MGREGRIIVGVVLGLGLLGLPLPLRAQPLLTPLEQAWVREHPNVRIQMCRDCPPFEYREAGRDKGLAYDLLVLAAEKTGLRVEVGPWTWSEALDSIQKGSKAVDLLLAATASPERSEHILFSRPYVSFPQVIFTTKEHPFVGSLQDLAQSRLVVEHDYLMEGLLSKALPQAELRRVTSTVQALSELSQGRADAYVGNLATGSHLIERLGLANLKVAAPSPFGDEAFSLAVSHDAPLLLGILQKGLDDISPAEQAAVRQRYLAVRYEHGVRPRDILLWALIVAAVAGLFIVQLRRMVAVRSRELAAEAERRAEAEARALRAERVEALGTLAAGIAHDFNNILAGIAAHVELATASAQDEALKQDLQVISQGVRRASELVGQIRAFSRQAPAAAAAIRPTEVAGEVLGLLRPGLPAGVQLRADLAAQGAVMADPADLHRILMNLCTNAVIALEPRGGTLRVESADAELTAPLPPALAALPPGPYVRLSVIDDGPGMSAEVQARIFDPFFSTRPGGRGTGLGLAVVHGLVRSRRGAIHCESAPGRGTRFDVYLPRVQQAPAPAPAPARAGQPKARRILFVDDEPLLTDAAVRQLQALGHAVEGYTSPQRAWERFCAEPDAFDAVVLDRHMPGMGGVELAAELRRLKPSLCLILCSGFHTDSPDVGHPGALFDAAFDKPVPMAAIIAALANHHRS